MSIGTIETVNVPEIGELIRRYADGGQDVALYGRIRRDAYGREVDTWELDADTAGRLVAYLSARQPDVSERTRKRALALALAARDQASGRGRPSGTRIGRKNMTLQTVEQPDGSHAVICYSYTTPVAARVYPPDGRTTTYVTDRHYSATTTRHIREFLNRAGWPAGIPTSPAELEALATG